MYSPQQPNLLQIFQTVDTDRSGRISSDELQRALSNGTWRTFNPETCRIMISMFDSDNDGGISFNEFQALWNVNLIILSIVYTFFISSTSTTGVELSAHLIGIILGILIVVS